MRENCYILVLLYLIICSNHVVLSGEESADSGSDLGSNLITSLRNDANLDLSVDEEYEDLRAELLAYHTALSSLVSESRRSMITTPCWQLGGICINVNLCPGFNYLTEVPGCKDTLRVCCFVWNRYNIKGSLPRVKQIDFGGKGVLDISTTKKRRRPNVN
ncbi:uncharacterized protein LOC113517915 [Galleria mellonella]|uniref:Uncharacterized protein LOC113517915 n=1 Tax=Galleria mellonella TaxID=7137 RepID=A0A6J1WS36_GALME|nr:uncharacterized protein LOC113517915 [Galleria mellonella]